MSFRTGDVEYIMKQKDHKCRSIKSVIFTLLEFSCLTRNTMRDADLSYQNACLAHMQMMQKSKINLTHFIVNMRRWC